MVDPIRVGIIGYDTSHAPAFARLLNQADVPYAIGGARVVCGFPSYSEDIESSRGRVEEYRRDLAALGVRESASIGELLEQVDAVLLESVDGRRHLTEVIAVLEAGKPVFVDKPLAASYKDALEIARHAEGTGTRLFSASSLRYDANVLSVLDSVAGQPVYGCDAFSPATLEETNPGLFWYGVHAVELLYTFMGMGCRSVRCVSMSGAEVVVGEWEDGRLGTVRGTRSGDHDYGVTVHSTTTHQTRYNREIPIYAQLLQRIVAFFGGQPAPVAPAETLETMAFVQAALTSAAEGGRAVQLAELC
ncbi:MAG: Gfo/Idh/MocA family oxidoreductase [Anaerolineae bacterium]